MIGCAIAGAGSVGSVFGWEVVGIGYTRGGIMVDGGVVGRWEEKRVRGAVWQRVNM